MFVVVVVVAVMLLTLVTFSERCLLSCSNNFAVYRSLGVPTQDTGMCLRFFSKKVTVYVLKPASSLWDADILETFFNNDMITCLNRVGNTESNIFEKFLSGIW